MAILMAIVGACCLLFGAILVFPNPTVTIGNFQFSAALLFIIAGTAIILGLLRKTDDESVAQMTKGIKLWHIFLICIVVLTGGAISGFLLRSVVVNPATSFKPYDVFKDVFFANLAIGSLFIALLGVLVYKFVEKRLYEETKLSTDKITSSIYANLYNQISFLHWVNYEKERNTKYLDKAILFVSAGFFRYEKYFDEKDLKSLELVCAIKNNWGYYLAEKQREQDREIALNCAEFLKKHSHKFPQTEEIWRRTIKSIQEIYPSS